MLLRGFFHVEIYSDKAEKEQKMKKFAGEDAGKTMIHVLGILLGNIFYALAVTGFIMPNDLITGGTTGLGLFVNRMRR